MTKAKTVKPDKPKKEKAHIGVRTVMDHQAEHPKEPTPPAPLGPGTATKPPEPVNEAEPVQKLSTTCLNIEKLLAVLPNDDGNNSYVFRARTALRNAAMWLKMYEDEQK